MKNFKIFAICVFGVYLADNAIYWANGKTIPRIDVEKYRNPNDVLSHLEQTSLKPLIPFLATIPQKIGNVEQSFVDSLFPKMRKIVDKNSIFPVGPVSLSNLVPLKMQKKLATMKIQPLFNALDKTPFVHDILVFIQPFADPLMNPLKPILYLVLKLMVNLLMQKFFTGWQ